MVSGIIKNVYLVPKDTTVTASRPLNFTSQSNIEFLIMQVTHDTTGCTTWRSCILDCIVCGPVERSCISVVPKINIFWYFATDCIVCGPVTNNIILCLFSKRQLHCFARQNNTKSNQMCDFNEYYNILKLDSKNL